MFGQGMQDGKKWSGNRGLRQQAREILATSLQALPAASMAISQAAALEDNLKQHLIRPASSPEVQLFHHQILGFWLESKTWLLIAENNLILKQICTQIASAPDM